jgi:hypothetical protein
MALTKIIESGSQQLDVPTIQLVRFSSRGLRGSDLDAFVKRASVQFADQISSLPIHPGEVPAHIVAIGAFERFGGNRNGDAFMKTALQRYHPTFVKHARVYRDHINKDPSKNYGRIVASAYNDQMDRAELLVALNGTKEAAARNGGLVADKELEKLEKGEDIGASMSCRVGYDKCLACGNEAQTRADYCGPEKCATYGGCRDNLAKTFDDGFTLCVDNPHPTFFDISHVFRPADRIAYMLGKVDGSRMAKAASCGEAIGGAALAEAYGVTAPLWLGIDSNNPALVNRLKIAQALCDAEDTAQTQPAMLARAFTPLVQPAANLPQLKGNMAKFAQVLTALAANNCMLPLPEFVTLLTGQETTKLASVIEQTAECLPGVYNRLAADPQLEQALLADTYTPGTPAPADLYRWAYKQASHWSLDRPHVVQRLQLASLRAPDHVPTYKPLRKVATVTKAEQLAKEYALYQIGLLAKLADAPDHAFRVSAVVAANCAG